MPPPPDISPRPTAPPLLDQGGTPSYPEGQEPIFGEVPAQYITKQVRPGTKPGDHESRVLIHTIHDGRIIPEFLLPGPQDPRRGEKLAALHARYWVERDWGANTIAGLVAANLKLGQYYIVPIARHVLDFGRTAGASAPDADLSSRRAFNPPVLDLVTELDRLEELHRYYDGFAARLEEHMRARLPDGMIGKHEFMQIAIHTYDPRNDSGTRRPPVSVILRPRAYQERFRLEHEEIDPLFPAVLAEFTADRILAQRIALTLESRYITTAINFPYSLPVGSVELRSQVWFFFRWLEDRHRTAWLAEGRGDRAAYERRYELVWRMLQHPSRREADLFELRHHLHGDAAAMPPVRASATFDTADATAAYGEIHAFLRESELELVQDYRFSACRPSSLVVEVRKDWLLEDPDSGSPEKPGRIDMDRASRLAEHLARAVDTYLEDDLPAKAERMRRMVEQGIWPPDSRRSRR